MGKDRLGVLLGAVVMLLCMGAFASAGECDDIHQKLISRSPPTSLPLTCDLTLDPEDPVTTKLVISGDEGDGVTLDCGGATLNGGAYTPNAGKDMIEIRSVFQNGTWRRPEDVTIRNCKIIGSMRIYGLGPNGEAEGVRESSHHANHVTVARRAAPTRILLDELTFTATGRTPLYIAPGVTYVTLTNSKLAGNGTDAAIYLDAETAYNTIKDNYIHVKILDEGAFGINRLGPQISVDGSSHNRIISNRFSAIEGGGIYLYRNCGYKGTVRHSTPSYNEIINNVFVYLKDDADHPAIYLSAHDGGFWRELPWAGTCDDDDGYDWGSSISNDDYASHNVVMQNQIYKHTASRAIKQGGSASRNVIAFNDSQLKKEIDRAAGCYLENGYKKLLLDGETSDVVQSGRDIPACSRTRSSCSDGVLRTSRSRECKIHAVPFDCAVDGNNEGCLKFARCPSGTEVVGARAACNLETSSVSQPQISRTPINRLSIVQPSDNASEGICQIAGSKIRTGSVSIEDAIDRARVTIFCRDRDVNGGDCEIGGVLYCR